MQRGPLAQVKDVVTLHSALRINHVSRADVAERRRLARELHDQAGTWICVAQRQLELIELSDGSLASDPHLAKATEALAKAAEVIRQLIGDLRLPEPHTTLEQALVNYVHMAATDQVQVQVTVTGDEDLAAPAVLDEVFMVVRESLRNALMHAQADSVSVCIEFTPGLLKAVIHDNGIGFDPQAVRNGTGIQSMRERVALLGGRLAMRSAPAEGTRVVLAIRLPGGQDEHP